MACSYLVTGAGGFVGRNLIRHITSKEPQSIVLSLPRGSDLTDSLATRNFFEGTQRLDYIYHLADKSGNHKWTTEHSFDQFSTNCKMHLNVLEAWKSYQPQAKLIFVSSVWAYPENLTIASESDYWAGPLQAGIAHFGYSKKLVDVALHAARQQYGLSGSTLVLGTCYGPGDASDHLIPTIIRRMKDDPESLQVYGTGEECRDFVFISDQVAALHAHKDTSFDLLNISSGKVTSIREVVETIVELSGYMGKVCFSSDRSLASTQAVRALDVSKARALQSVPITFRSLRDGLKQTLGT